MVQPFAVLPFCRWPLGLFGLFSLPPGSAVGHQGAASWHWLLGADGVGKELL